MRTWMRGAEAEDLRQQTTDHGPRTTDHGTISLLVCERAQRAVCCLSSVSERSDAGLERAKRAVSSERLAGLAGEGDSGFYCGAGAVGGDYVQLSSCSLGSGSHVGEAKAVGCLCNVEAVAVI